jgi:alpha-tubulin suppressor-like RCC1 family protein
MNMVSRSISAAFRLCAAGILVVLGTTALLQVVGADTAAAATSTPALFGWGVTPTLQSLPGDVTATAVAADSSDGFAIGSDGNLYAWGYSSFSNSLGGLGDGNTTNSFTPVAVSLPSGVSPTAIATAGTGFPFSSSGYAIGSDGSLYAWGYNADGELGDGTTTGPDNCNNGGGPVACSTTPIKVALPTGVTPKAIATTSGSAYAIGSDGHLYAWGYNGSGELGDGTTTSSDTPVVVSLPSGVTPTAIAGGEYGDAYAIGSDGHLYAWGDNIFGELGDGNDTGPDLCAMPNPIGPPLQEPCSTVPVQVSLPSGVTPTAIAGGGPHDGYAIGSDGHLYAWGYNADGELGDGTNTGPDLCTVPEIVGTQQNPCSTVPVQVLLPSGVTPTAVAQNQFGGSVIGADNNIYAWGGGNLGDGSSGPSSTPVVVSMPTGSSPVALGQDVEGFSYAIVNAPDVAPSITTNPTNQSVSAGQDAKVSAAASGIPAPTVQWQVSTDGGSTFSPVSGATSDSLTISSVTLSENGYEYEAVFTNGSGTATTNPATLTVIPPPPPTTTVNIPSNGATVSGDIWLGASAQSVVGVKSVSYEVSGGSVSNLVVSSSGNSEWGWIGAWDTTDVANGTYTLQSVATDTNGNSAPSPGVSVTVDNLPLHTQVLVPSNGATLNGTGAVLDAIASGTSDVTGVQFEVTGGSLSGHVVGTAGATIYGWIALWDTTTVPNGSYTLQSVATETGGTTATSPGITINVTN